MIRRPPRSTRTELSFPTRRSSDLLAKPPTCALRPVIPNNASSLRITAAAGTELAELILPVQSLSSRVKELYNPKARSEEHTSELQSLMRISYAVFCLKKKKSVQLHTMHILNLIPSQTTRTI